MINLSYSRHNIKQPSVLLEIYKRNQRSYCSIIGINRLFFKTEDFLLSDCESRSWLRKRVNVFSCLEAGTNYMEGDGRQVAIRTADHGLNAT